MKRFGVSMAAALLVALSATLIPASASTGWSIVPSRDKVLPHSGLAAISCRSASACEAVGRSTDSKGAGLATAERWNGVKWSLQPIPSPAGAAFVGLMGISCGGANRCTAVGSSYTNTSSAVLAEGWNGTAWSVETMPVPAGATTSNLNGVSCPSATECIAVGNYFNGSTTLTLAEKWDGTSWSIQPTPNPAGSNFNSFDGVSCSSTTTCEAVGSFGNGPMILAEGWNGSTWTVQTAPNPSTSSILAAVSCFSATRCTGVGNYFTGSTTLTLAEAWNGTAWTVEATPNPAGALGSALASVSCAAANRCIATGDYFTNSANGTLAEEWNGSTWSILATPSPAGATGAFLSGVSCPSMTSCTAAGTYFNRVVDQALAETWNGTSWTIQLPPNPAGEVATFLAGVSCTAATACVGAGSYGELRGSSATLVEAWNGTTWGFQTTPNPSGSGVSGFNGVACTASTACTAVGSYTKSTTTRTLAERWNGTAWSIESTPNPSGAAFSNLFGVACASATMCTAVGRSSAGSTTRTLAETWNGSSWAIQATPNPAGSTFSALNSVSCPATNQCTAAGSYYNGSVTVSLVEEWNGTTWTIQSTPAPAGAFSYSLSGIACPSTSQCTAVGNYATSTTTLSLAEKWNGTVWTVQTTPGPSGSTSSSLTAVSCPSTSECTGVGNYTTSGFTNLTLAERWNGTAWSIQSTPNPSGSSSNNFNGVSCPTTVACMAVGIYFSFSPRTLAEKWSA